MAETIAYLNILHPDYGKLAARVAVTRLHKDTSDKFMDVIEKLYRYTEAISKSPIPPSLSIISSHSSHKDRVSY